jgi:ribosomal protein S12 methylthiotransferase
VDMPMQHASDAMLRTMRRGHDGRALRLIVERLRRKVPDLVFRSTFIVGHPGETQADFDELCALVRWAGFERLGVFPYSDEAGTPSHGLGHKVPPLVAWNRYRQLMAVGRRISRRANRALVGRQLDVLVEGPSDEHPWVLMGRHRGQAPEIDGQVYVSTEGSDGPPPRAGQLVRMSITQASDYDLVGVPLD